jgi:hypothetical protein
MWVETRWVFGGCASSMAVPIRQYPFPDPWRTLAMGPLAWRRLERLGVDPDTRYEPVKKHPLCASHIQPRTCAPCKSDCVLDEMPTDQGRAAKTRRDGRDAMGKYRMVGFQDHDRPLQLQLKQGQRPRPRFDILSDAALRFRGELTAAPNSESRKEWESADSGYLRLPRPRRSRKNSVVVCFI